MIYPSPLPYDAATKATLVGALRPLVVDLLDLGACARLAHWTVRGPYTQTLHLLFGSFYDAIDEQADAIAEYVRLLGAQPIGTVQEIADTTRLTPYPAATVDGLAHCKALSERAAQFLRLAAQAIVTCNDVGAADALDLVTVLVEAVSKPAGFIVDHLVPEDEEAEPESEPKPEAGDAAETGDAAPPSKPKP